ncbi:hypothetical protein C1645_766175 [Glomus cerebriforme]|uniref:Uncharacterized protein n=1 Tax=Glomus cerebriforme TaxID=658196 RepID=A0A397T6R9_9GLOM|nr:hypothetical protein C1645_766175 [Glomus cerebriforme]
MATGGSFSYSTSKSELPGLTEDEPISERWDRYWVSYPSFRHGFIVMTAVWGVGLIAEVPIRVIIVFGTPENRAVYLSNIATYSWLIILVIFSIIYVRRFRKRGEKKAVEAAVVIQASGPLD